jgi:hypothetical protein
MRVEEKIKNIILNRYKSLREFSIEYDIPYTTLKSMLERGVGNSSVTNVIKLCKALNISADALADGEITQVKERTTCKINDRIEIKEVLDNAKDLLIHHGSITLDGNPISKKGIEAIIDAMEVGVEIAKKKN